MKNFKKLQRFIIGWSLPCISYVTCWTGFGHPTIWDDCLKTISLTNLKWIDILNNEFEYFINLQWIHNQVNIHHILNRYHYNFQRIQNQLNFLVAINWISLHEFLSYILCVVIHSVWRLNTFLSLTKIILKNISNNF